MWKYVDDTTICEIVAKNQSSSLQSAVEWIEVFDKNASNDKFQSNEGKSKELRINFCTKTNDNIHAIKKNDKETTPFHKQRFWVSVYQTIYNGTSTLMK